MNKILILTLTILGIFGWSALTNDSYAKELESGGNHFETEFEHMFGHELNHEFNHEFNHELNHEFHS